MLTIIASSAIMLQAQAIDIEVHRVWTQTENRDYRNARAIVEATNEGQSTRLATIECQVLDGERIVGTAEGAISDFYSNTSRTIEVMAHRVPEFDSMRCSIGFVSSRAP